MPQIYHLRAPHTYYLTISMGQTTKYKPEGPFGEKITRMTLRFQPALLSHLRLGVFFQAHGLLEKFSSLQRYSWGPHFLANCGPGMLSVTRGYLRSLPVATRLSWQENILLKGQQDGLTLVMLGLSLTWHSNHQSDFPTPFSCHRT